MSYRLRISEIFYSLQGESSLVGWPTVFVRLTGCPLRCGYCDTTYAFKGGEWLERDAILQQVGQYQAQYVCVTGGEPLAQKDCLALLADLCDAGYRVSLETSGALPIDAVDQRVMRVMDLKTPASGEQDKNLYSNLELLTADDELKFVLCDRNDYEWARELVQQHDMTKRCTVLFSPSQQQLPARQLAEWILEDRLPVRFQLQLHKILWGDVAGH
ncbi:MAG: 7-carboxy-7-deazaguanine synthase QueE [Chromatiales bacterium]|jgi:7-carboxy-7-deazaguanine synthase